jgi:hypothetical protein
VANEADGPTKNDATELPVAPIWRATFEAIVAAFIAGDWKLETAPANVKRVQAGLASLLQANVAAYGDLTLVPLPCDTWDSSVSIWTGERWQVLVDLWTDEEGRSDLVLDAIVTEAEDEFVFEVYLIYTP